MQLVWGEQDLRTAWHLTDPEFRTCLAQRWILDNEQEFASSAWERDEVVSAFEADAPDHELWHHFERVHLRGWRQLGDLTQFGTGTATRVVALDVEEVLLFPPEVTELQPGEESPAVPILLRHTPEVGWRVLNFGSEVVPQPGWPPLLG